MFNRDGLFGKKDENPRHDLRGVNVTPSLGTGAPLRPQPAAESPKPDLRFAEPQKMPAPRVEEPAGSKLIVGPDIKLKGVEITDCDTLVVEGRVEASMDSRVVQIAESGVFSGKVSIDVAEIRGRFEGELTARKQLVIYSTGRVSGRIHYGKIRIEEGGELSGDISTLTAAPAAPAATIVTATVPTATVTTAARPAQPAAAALSEPESSTLHLPPQSAARPSKPGKVGAGVNTV